MTNMNSKKTLLIIILISIFLLFLVFPISFNKLKNFLNNKFGLSIPDFFNIPFRLGLDLLGGTHLVYQADFSGISGRDGFEAMAGIRDVIERRVNFFGVTEPLVQVVGKDRLVVELAGVKDIKEAIRLIGETPFLDFREEDVQPSDQPQGFNFKPTGLTGQYLKNARLIFDPNTYEPQVSLEFNDQGAKLFGDITKRNVGKRVAIFLDGVPISIPIVQSEILTGQAVISGKFTPKEAKELATRLNAGALPVPVKLVSQQTIGASLGHQSLVKSLRAGIFALIFVALFMILFYRLPGIVSVIALGIYIVIVLALYKLIPVTLTLAGIAGFILSLGMAVDANILIFARTREELAAGKSLTVAISEGFRRAWFSIRDSHVTTLIGAAVLYMFTTSIVKGFALTLGIGVLISLFTATTVTKSFLNLFISSRLERRPWLFR